MTTDEVHDAMDQEPRERRPVPLLIVAVLLVLLCLCVAGAAAAAVIVTGPTLPGVALPGLDEGGGGATATVEVTPVPPTPTPSPAPPTDTPTPAPPPGNFPDLLDDGTLTLDGVEPTGGGITGPGVLTVRVTNTSTQPVDATVPPGYVFAPPGGVDEQRMMVLQATTASIPPGQSATLDPYVACIDASKHAPGVGTAYSAGGMVEDEKLLAFATCLDGLELPTLDPAAFAGGNIEDIMMSEPVLNFFSLQFAVWQMAGDFSPDSVQAEAMQTAFGGEFFTAVSERSAAWITQCGLEP